MEKKKYPIILSITIVCIAFYLYQSILSFDEELEYYYDYMYPINIRKNPPEYEGTHLNSWTTYKAAIEKDSLEPDNEYFIKKVSKKELRKKMDSENIENVMYDRQEKVIWIFRVVRYPTNDLYNGEIRLTIYYWKKIF